MEPAEGWDWFVRKTRRVPLLGCNGASAQSLPEATALTAPRGARAAALAMGLLSGGMFIGIGLWFIRRTGDAGIWGFVGFGALLVLICLLALCDRTQVRLDRLSGRVVLKRTFLLPTIRVELPAQGLRAEMGMIEKSDILNRFGKGYSVVRLLCDGRAGAVQIVAGETRKNVQAAYDQVCRFLGRSGLDATAATVTLNDGVELPMCRAPMGAAWSADFRTHRLRFPRPGVAVMAPSAGQRLFFFAFAAIGAAALAGCLVPLPAGWPFLVVPLLVGVAFGLFGMLGPAGWFGPPRVVADLAARTLTVGRRRRSTYALGDLAGLQVCCREQADSDSTYLTYELDLVLRQPAGRRVNLVCHANRESIFRDGRALAKFLAVPFWDHTTTAQGDSRGPTEF